MGSDLASVCGRRAGKSKRTKNWSDGWLAKLRGDQRTAKAEISVLVSQVLPQNVEAFDLVDGVWVTHPRVALPVAIMLDERPGEVTLRDVLLTRMAEVMWHPINRNLAINSSCVQSCWRWNLTTFCPITLRLRCMIIRLTPTRAFWG
jgi:hypothetical protein